jgi:hypothetical protein
VKSVAATALALVPLLAGCYRTVRLPAPPQPTPVVPAVALDGSPAGGLARVVLDAADGPALVETISGGAAAARLGTTTLGGSLTVSSRLCTTPCVVDLPPGPHELRYTLLDDPDRTSTAFVNVDGRPSVYRHAVGRQENNAWKGYVGWPLLSVGVLLSLGGLQVAADPDSELDSGDFAVGMGFAVGVAVVGGWLVWGATVVEQPGAGVPWHP